MRNKLRYSLLVILLVSCFTAGAQVNFATYVNLSHQVTAIHKRNGEALVHAEKNRFRIYAWFKDGKVTSFYAVDPRGYRLNGLVSKVRQHCEVSFRAKTDGKLFCYDLDCDVLAPPPATAKKH